MLWLHLISTRYQSQDGQDLVSLGQRVRKRGPELQVTWPTWVNTWLSAAASSRKVMSHLAGRWDPHSILKYSVALSTRFLRSISESCLVFSNLIYSKQEMERISKQMLLWLLTHANSWTKFRSVIKHRAIFEPRVTGQIRCPEEAPGWFTFFISVFHLPLNALTWGRKKYIHWLRNLSQQLSWGSRTRSGSRHAGFVIFFKGCPWSESCLFNGKMLSDTPLEKQGREEQNGHHLGSCHSCSEWFMVSQHRLPHAAT